MKELTVYQSIDGQTFFTKEECLLQDAHLMLLEVINPYSNKGLDTKSFLVGLKENSQGNTREFLLAFNAYLEHRDYNKEEESEDAEQISED